MLNWVFTVGQLKKIVLKSELWRTLEIDWSSWHFIVWPFRPFWHTILLPRALRASSTEKDREGEGEGGGESSRQACEIQAGAGRLLPHVTQPNIISWPYLPYKKATLEKRGNHGVVKITNLKGHLLNRLFMTPRTILKMFKILSSTGCFTTLDTRVLQRPIFLETT